MTEEFTEEFQNAEPSFELETAVLDMLVELETACRAEGQSLKNVLALVIQDKTGIDILKPVLTA